MGQAGSAAEEDVAEDADHVDLTNFEILRNIGRGSFGKVCIVQKVDNKRMYAMKYISKAKCFAQDAFRSVLREVTIMCDLDHPFLVNLWFSFEDEDYFFQVFDVFMGGDLRYHMGQQGQLGSDQVKLYVLELALALDYLRQQRVVHRDVKPDNILLDDEGHAHLTDFNIATTLTSDSLATSESGTKPYMAPELLGVQLRYSLGYSYAVDWWSLGVACYEMVAGSRPYPIRSNSSAKTAYEIIMDTMIPLPSSVDDELAKILAGLLSINEKNRLTAISDIQKVLTTQVDLKVQQDILRRRVDPVFKPSQQRLNCDPTYELEEMLIENDPLHRRKKNKDKQLNPGSESSERKNSADIAHEHDHHLPLYNREKLMKDEEERIKRLEEELGIRSEVDAIAKRLGAVD